MGSAEVLLSMDGTHGERKLAEFLRRVSVSVRGVPVFAVAAEPGALGGRYFEKLIWREGEVSHCGFLPWAVYGLPMLGGVLAEQEPARGIQCEGT